MSVTLRGRWCGMLASAALAASCGYRAVYGGASSEERLSVAAAPHLVPDLAAVHAALAGARAELGRAGSLRGEQGYPRLLIEVLRIDELPSGIVSGTDLAGRDRPLARGATIAVSVRGLVLASANGEVVVDTGDLQRTAQFASSADPRSDAAARDSAVRAAARSAGRAAARRALGLPEPSVEPL